MSENVNHKAVQQFVGKIREDFSFQYLKIFNSFDPQQQEAFGYYIDNITKNLPSDPWILSWLGCFDLKYVCDKFKDITAEKPASFEIRHRELEMYNLCDELIKQMGMTEFEIDWIEFLHEDPDGKLQFRIVLFIISEPGVVEFLKLA